MFEAIRGFLARAAGQPLSSSLLLEDGHVHRWTPLRRGYPQAVCLCGALRASALQIGEHTITLSPAGVGDVIRWSATASPAAAGDIGMSTANGRARQFVNAQVQEIGSFTGTGPAAMRIVASGTTAVAAATTVTLATVTRNAGERLVLLMFVSTNTLNILFSPDESAIGPDTVTGFFRKLAAANQANARAVNSNAVTARTLDWMVFGISP